MIHWFMEPFNRFFEFNGRSRRREFWTYTLGLMLLVAFFILMEIVTGGEPLIIEFWDRAIIALAIFTFIPSLAVSVRRLHDQDRSGWWLLLALIPLLGGLGLLVMMGLAGTTGPNRFGEDPKRVVAADVQETFD